jgi:general secretion pathway protein G
MERKQKYRHTVDALLIALVLLAGAAVLLPVHITTMTEAKELTLRQDLYTLRNTIDQYTLDHRRRPQSTTELIADGYLKQMPTDPITGRDDTWVLKWSGDANMPGIVDVHSGSHKKSRKGSAYSEW